MFQNEQIEFKIAKTYNLLVVGRTKMDIKIEDDECVRLIIELSRATCFSHTEAITVAVKEKLARMNSSIVLEEELVSLAKDSGPRLTSIKDHAALLYGQEGLPH